MTAIKMATTLFLAWPSLTTFENNNIDADSSPGHEVEHWRHVEEGKNWGGGRGSRLDDDLDADQDEYHNFK